MQLHIETSSSSSSSSSHCLYRVHCTVKCLQAAILRVILHLLHRALYCISRTAPL